ncbi:DUF803-domain-containing protein [Trametes versicolor FP-101664 SS1]|uniref:DUF803-domain-containing protein n=1 Tax=Trametes versicolor (strain FP-101664) TaxID=717944 RepID=UPI00046239A6|nr:DUF803-domain-containing protein [Trametes versicolor FP-101664 SS1]EIW64173.1 DUF803-domain-containing protein [Trametes versicolor FP-101664 SS1]
MSSSSDSTQPAQYRAVGVVLAIGSGLLIGSSFVFKKKGLLSAQKGHVAGEGVGYLKSPMWWTGMIIMILGELCNFGAYAFVEAIIVTPMGALSVVISSILSHFLLKEKLSLFGWISSVQCLLGASILALNGPEEQSVSTIEGFKHLFLAPWFLAYGSVVLVAAGVLAFWAAPKWGKQSMLPYIGVCSLIGGLSVSCTQGLGASIVTSIRGDNQFKNWFIYFLLVFVVITLLTEIYYLNIALAMFNTVHTVTPTYYVTFTFCTLVTSVILYQGLKASASQIITVVLAFAVICTGIVILQMTKVDPRTLTNVDERTTLLLEAARQEVDPIAAQAVDLAPSGTLRSRRSRQRSRRTHSHAGTVEAGTDADSAAARSTDDLEAGLRPDEESDLDQDFADEKRAIVARTEEPGIDSLRMTGGAIGTIIRARRRATALSAASATRSRTSQLSSVAETGSMHSARASASTRRASPRGDSRSPAPGTRPSWFKAFMARRAATADSDIHAPTSNGAEMSEKAQVAVSTAEVPVSGLPPITSESPLSSLTDSAQQARFLSSAELVSSPLVTPSSAEAPRLSTVRFQPDMRSAASVPDVRPHAPGLPPPPSRPSLTVSGDDAAARARTLPLAFTPAERVRADDVLREKPATP